MTSLFGLLHLSSFYPCILASLHLSFVQGVGGRFEGLNYDLWDYSDFHDYVLYKPIVLKEEADCPNTGSKEVKPIVSYTELTGFISFSEGMARLQSAPTWCDLILVALAKRAYVV